MITADAPSTSGGQRLNVAATANGGIATASSTTPYWAIEPLTFSPMGAIDGDRYHWGNHNAWRDFTDDAFPDWLQVDFNGPKSLDEIDVFTLEDGADTPPTETMTFSLYGITAFDVQYWNGSSWQTVTNGSVTGNNKVWRKFTFSPITTSKIRVVVNNALYDNSRIVELEAYGTPAGPGRTNFGLAANGTTAVASSTTPDTDFSGMTFHASAVNDGDRSAWGYWDNSFWRDGTNDAWPDWMELDFNGQKTVDEVGVFSMQDTIEGALQDPTEAMTFSVNGLTAFDVQYWNGSAWVTVPGGSITGNNKVWKKLNFAAVSTTKIRVTINSALNHRSRMIELEAWGPDATATANIHWLVTDQLGTPRMIADQSGSLSGISRHDYLPFGEELNAGTGFRTTSNGYSASDNVRQKFTGYERDPESGLDYAHARYYSNNQGRFTSIDPVFLKKARLIDPQQLNLYAYVRSNPLKYVDITGEDLTIAVTNIAVGTSHINSQTKGRGARETVNIYKVIVTNETGRIRTFAATRDTNYNGPASKMRGNYGTDSETPPGDYKGHIRTDGSRGFRVELYDPNVKQSAPNARDTINAPDGTPRTNNQIHIGPGCSEGCILLTGGTQGRDDFQQKVNSMLAEDKANGFGTDINVTVQPRNPQEGARDEKETEQSLVINNADPDPPKKKGGKND